MKDGGPAFPTTEYLDSGREAYHIKSESNGMSIRDYFAGQALAGLLARGEPEFMPSHALSEDGRYIQDTAYRIAAAMLSARKGPESDK